MRSRTRAALIPHALTMALALAMVSSQAVLGEDPSPASSSALSAAYESWGQVPFEAGLRDPYGASEIAAVAAGPHGIVAVGMSPTGAAAWHSVDGLAWARAVPPRSWTKPGPHHQFPLLEDVIATEGGFVAVGIERNGPKRFHGNIGSVWTSEDGLIWHRSARGVGPYLEHIVEHDGRFFAASGRVHLETPGAVWVSDDAVEWEQAYLAPDDGDIEVIASDGARLVAGSVEAMAFTDDGESWSEAPIEQVGTCHCWLEDATAYDGGFFAVGAHSDRGAAWHSSDGRSWQSVPETVDTGAYITHLRSVTSAPSGGLLVVAGTDEYAGRLYHSADGHSFGEPVLGVDGVDIEAWEWPFNDVVEADGRALVVGYQPDGPRRHSAAAWTSPPSDAQATPGEATTTCPGANPTIDELVAMDPAARLECYRDDDLSFRAWLAPHETGVLEFYSRPHWLTAGDGGRRALPVEGSPWTTMSLVVHVRPSDRKELDLPRHGWVRISGHFDDRAARKCPDHWRDRCRQAFVVSNVRLVR